MSKGLVTHKHVKISDGIEGHFGFLSLILTRLCASSDKLFFSKAVFNLVLSNQIKVITLANHKGRRIREMYPSNKNWN